ncbi:hypothetical protein AMC83_PE00279 (plasmid) [Rhizobium phaseoli]|nr:hypothetical protein AMC83_PE00279 [Rhizobium phaseoli]
MTEPVSTVAHIRTRDDNPYLNAALNKVSWGAILAGVAVALVVQLRSIFWVPASAPP